MENRATLKKNEVAHTQLAESLVPKKTETGEAGIDDPPIDETLKPFLKRYRKTGSRREVGDTHTSRMKSTKKESSSSEQKKPAIKPMVKARPGRKPASEQADSNLNTNSKAENPENEAFQKEDENWNVVLSKNSSKCQQKKTYMGTPNSDSKTEIKRSLMILLGKYLGKWRSRQSDRGLCLQRRPYRRRNLSFSFVLRSERTCRCR